MTQLPAPPNPIPNPTPKPAEDFYRLRREGIGFVEQMGSRLWTDYNTHDPGITILEALSYTITDLAYRTSWDIRDILASATPAAGPQNPYPNQPFFPARDILTVNPTTPHDFRRLLIDLEAVRNAWVTCKECACDVVYYAWCEKDQLVLCYQLPPGASTGASPRPGPQLKKVEPLGLYEVLLELETAPELGDLNDRKLEQRYDVFDSEGRPHTITLELRFPGWGSGRRAEWDIFLRSDDAFAGRNGASFNLTLLKLNRTKADSTPMGDAALRANWQGVFYASFEIELKPGGQKIAIDNAALRLFGDNFARGQATVAALAAILGDKSTSGFVQRYRNKLLAVEQAVRSAKAALHAHRNLDEDYCRVRGVDVEDVAVCADVEVTPDADVERVQAEIWFQIEQYLNPPIPFYTLQELLAAGVPVEDIFNGPELSSGFLKAEDLAAAGLKTVLRTSDILNRLMDIPGVVAVNNLLLTKYDSEGAPVKGAADPTWSNGTPLFDPNKVSAAWLLFVSPLRQPRLYRNLSRFLFYKNGLPFLPRMDEAQDTLTQLHGEAQRPKIKGAPNDLPIPPGNDRHPEDYFPVQYSFPLTYGIGPAGLPTTAPALRRAQAKQLKAYLMVFEQLLGNAFAQVAHTADLFSLDPSVRRTYFVREFSEALIQGYSELVSGLTKPTLEGLVETLPEFQERRNRFLDHVLARFGEQFGEYALLLTNLAGQRVALDELILDKITFLKAYPRISHDRARAFNYLGAPCSPDNVPGLKKRISRLLGYPDLSFAWQALSSPNPPDYTQTLTLKDQNDAVSLAFEPNGDVTTALEAYLAAAGLAGTPQTWEIDYQDGQLPLIRTDASGHRQVQDLLAPEATSEARALLGALVAAFQAILTDMVQPDRYAITPSGGQFTLTLADANGDPLGARPGPFKTRAEAEAFRETLANWSGSERAIVVEHLLLRPKFPGDALYPACTDGPCQPCGDEDPYSFRLTFVMPGWTAPYNTNLDLRGFADRTIQQETPSHLLGKTCWVGNDGFVANPCDPVVDDLAALLEAKGRTSAGERLSTAEACECATAIYNAFSDVFEGWYEDRTLDYHQPDALQAALEAEFSAKVNPATITCAAVLDAALWAEVQAKAVAYFLPVALYGWQFERFEDAWCKWLTANAHLDWTEERLQEAVEAILASNRVSGPAARKDAHDELCKCAAAVLTAFGMDFYNWMDANVKAGRAFEDFTAFSPNPVTLCTSLTFKPGTAQAIEALLTERYDTYKEVSYRLRAVVDLLSTLRNTYPGATLHDCDDGSDRNPIRLGQTALGSNLYGNNSR